MDAVRPLPRMVDRRLASFRCVDEALFSQQGPKETTGDRHPKTMLPPDTSPPITAGAGCFTGALPQVLYPVLMFACVLRTYFVRVRPSTLIVFTPKYDENAGEDREEGAPGPKPGIIARFKAGWAEEHSLLAWASKGKWETADTEDEETRREGQWFRIGFEPLFVDFTQTGAWFVAFTLVEVTICFPMRILSNHCVYAISCSNCVYDNLEKSTCVRVHKSRFIFRWWIQA